MASMWTLSLVFLLVNSIHGSLGGWFPVQEKGKHTTTPKTLPLTADNRKNETTGISSSTDRRTTDVTGEANRTITTYPTVTERKFERTTTTWPPITTEAEIKSTSWPTFTEEEVKSTTTAWPTINKEEAESTTSWPMVTEVEVESTTTWPTVTEEEVETTTSWPTVTEEEIESSTTWPTVTEVEVESTTTWPTVTEEEVESTTTWPTVTEEEIESKTTWPTVTEEEVTSTTKWPTVTQEEVESTTTWPTLTEEEVESTTTWPTVSEEEVESTTTALPTVTEGGVESTTIWPTVTGEEVESTTTWPTVTEEDVESTTTWPTVTEEDVESTTTWPIVTGAEIESTTTTWSPVTYTLPTPVNNGTDNGTAALSHDRRIQSLEEESDVMKKEISRIDAEMSEHDNAIEDLQEKINELQLETEWGPWSPFSNCSQSCISFKSDNVGFKNRSRECQYKTPSLKKSADDAICDGEAIESVDCTADKYCYEIPAPKNPDQYMGYDDGDNFSDENIWAGENITAITVYCITGTGWTVAIRARYGIQWGPLHGGNCTDAVPFYYPIGRREYVTHISVNYENGLFQSYTMATNQRHLFTCGRKNSDMPDAAINGTRLMYLEGKSEECLLKGLQPIWSVE